MHEWSLFGNITIGLDASSCPFAQSSELIATCSFWYPTYLVCTQDVSSMCAITHKFRDQYFAHRLFCDLLSMQIYRKTCLRLRVLYGGRNLTQIVLSYICWLSTFLAKRKAVLLWSQGGILIYMLLQRREIMKLALMND